VPPPRGVGREIHFAHCDAADGGRDFVRTDPDAGCQGHEGHGHDTSGDSCGADGDSANELDPSDPRNALITDLQSAPRNARGQVEYVATVALVKPTDMAKASGVPMYSVVNHTHDGDVQAVSAAARQLVKDGYVLQADAEAMIARAASSNILR
jgi:hypothetical protein